MIGQEKVDTARVFDRLKTCLGRRVVPIKIEIKNSLKKRRKLLRGQSKTVMDKYIEADACLYEPDRS